MFREIIMNLINVVLKGAISVKFGWLAMVNGLFFFFSLFRNDTLAYKPEQPGIESPTFQLVDMP